jgi:hypothetical protein
MTLPSRVGMRIAILFAKQPSGLGLRGLEIE